VFELAAGSKYFKWAACDDWIAPTFLESCVRELEENPDAVLCQSLVKIVGDDGSVFETYDHTAHGTGRHRPSERFGGRLGGHRCMDIFGVIRADVLAPTPLIERHLGADRTLLLELALCGRFLLVPEFLFFNRDHVERFTRRGVTPQEELAWYAADHGRRIVSRTWTLYGTSLRLIPRRVDGRPERARCYGRLLRSVGYRRRWLDLIVEPVSHSTRGCSTPSGRSRAWFAVTDRDRCRITPRVRRRESGESCRRPFGKQGGDADGNDTSRRVRSPCRRS
jgi:hypothetical protein